MFVACFSEHEDIIPQWKGYAAAGAGYAIGFDLERTALVTETIPLRVIYGRSEQDAVIDAAIDGYLDVLERSLEAHPGQEERTASAVGFTLVSVLTQLIAGFKDESFAHEREWRLVEFIRSGDKRRQAEIRFEPRRGVVVPFIQRPLGKASSELPIRRVCCGPIAAPEIAARGVTSFLRGAGLSSEVVLSKAPLRF